MKKLNFLSIMGQIAVVAGTLLLFLYLLVGLGKYDNISSGGTDDKIWLEPGGLNNEEIGFLVFLSISLILTGYPFWCYFREMKHFASWKDFLSLPLYKDMPGCISIPQSLLYVVTVLYYNLSLPSALLPMALYKENSVVSTFDDCLFLFLFTIWPFFLIGLFLHEILYWNMQRDKKVDADSTTAISIQ